MAITCKTVFCYCFFQLTLTMIYTNVPTARSYVYKDTLKLPLSTISWIMTAVKSIDILTGFLVGKLSDNTRTKWGRRKPYIVIAWPIATAVLLMLVGAGQIFTHSPVAHPCKDVNESASSTYDGAPAANATCNDELKACYDAAISNGTLLPWDSPYTLVGNQTSAQADPGVESYFFIFYLLYFTFVVSGSQIPYDALGQELSDTYEDRALLFTWKPIFNLLGAAIGSQVLTFISSMSTYQDDTAGASLLTFFVMTCFNAIAYFLLLWGVKERAQPPTPSATKALPFVVSLRRLLSVEPYRMYLTMRIPMTILGLLPYMTLLYYCQNNMEIESIQSTLGMTQIIALVGALIATPTMTWLASKYGRRATLTGLLSVVGVLFLIALFLPFDKMPSLIYILAPFLGVCLALPYVIPDAMLGDIIDYDELLTGERNEAMYSMVETNMQQLVEILLSAAQLCMAAAGFENLAGCECGCGVSCEKMVGYDARWVCPGSIGYSCDGTVGATLFYEAEPAMVPCTKQNDGVKLVTALFMFGLPGLAGLLAILPIRRAIISPEQHEQIKSGIAALKANASAAVNDPLTGTKVVRPTNSPATLFPEHFTAWEWALGKQGAALSSLKLYLGSRLSAYLVVFISFVFVNRFVDSDAVLQISFWLLAFLIVLVPYDSLRFVATAYPPTGSSFQEFSRPGMPDEKVGGGYDNL